MTTPTPSEPPTTVINLRDKAAVQAAKASGLFVRIDRASKWGNPFKIGKDDGGHHWSRAEVIALYDSWIHHNEPELAARARVELRGKILGCWCAPLACHGDVLARIADSEEGDGKQ